uniref:Uncharacterized protein n=1 Tax=Amphimedon queenslandica TaxID=400682 RepID=A0A1X7UBV2_AMPQE
MESERHSEAMTNENTPHSMLSKSRPANEEIEKDHHDGDASIMETYLSFDDSSSDMSVNPIVLLLKGIIMISIQYVLLNIDNELNVCDTEVNLISSDDKDTEHSDFTSDDDSSDFNLDDTEASTDEEEMNEEISHTE